jgi:hypothetical protein
MLIAKSILYFILAGLCEIGGGYLVWLWLREGKNTWLADTSIGERKYSRSSTSTSHQLGPLGGHEISLPSCLRLLFKLALWVKVNYLVDGSSRKDCRQQIDIPFYRRALARGVSSGFLTAKGRVLLRLVRAV